MKLNSKVTGGLAWAGLVVILAVPSADLLTRPAEGQMATALSSGNVDAIETASVQPIVKPPVPVPPLAIAERPAQKPAADGDVVDAYLASGKELPSYISESKAPVRVVLPAGPATANAEDAGKPAATQPAATTQLAAAPETRAVTVNGTFADKAQAAAQVASVQTAPTVTAPVPYPASKRPKPVAVAAVQEPEPLVIDETAVSRRQAALRAVEPLLSEPAAPVVGREQLEEWDSGSLGEYLARRGLISNGREQVETLESRYDEDGFFLSDGPERRSVRRPRNEFSFF